ncbi:MAG: alginate lyase family protein, partial [Planctomycetes bacterium]|nr:alginate lyase family protein [Planctomycetota bacterium]
MISKSELALAQHKIKTQPWAQRALKKLQDEADAIASDPLFFPNSEGGWNHHYVSPKTGALLEFNAKSPHHHLDPSTGEYLTGKKYDNAWNVTSMYRTADQMEKLSAAWVLTKEKKYIETIKAVFMDLARKYPNYRLHDKSMRFQPRVEPMGNHAPTGGFAFAQSINECSTFSSLAFSYDTLAGSDYLCEEEQRMMEKNIWQPLQAYLRRLMRLHPSGGNWWVWHSTGAIVIGVLMGDSELVDLGLNTERCGLAPHLFKHDYINQDGFTAELSPHYHRYAKRAFIPLAHALRRVGIDFHKIDRFKRIFDVP